MHIRWGNTFSTSVCAKRGSIMSLVLYNVYIDDLSCALNRSNNRGRTFGSNIVTHFSYADDLCLSCLSSAGTHQLLNMCSNYATLQCALKLQQ